MIISKTPYRVSFFGGGTDYPAWYRQAGGRVLSTTIDKYCYISCRTLTSFFNFRHKIVWSHIEAVNSISEILHPAVREGLRFLGFDDSIGLEIQHQGDLPARSGIGSSSSFSVGLINILSALRNEHLSAAELAAKAIDLEQNVLKENVGSQDQVAAAFGGLNLIHFSKTGEIRVEPVQLAAERSAALQSRLLLFYTGTSRLASLIASDIIRNIPRKRDVLHRMMGLVDESVEILRGSADLDDFGRLLNVAWTLKRTVAADVTNPAIDEIYATAIEKGALGGKLLGAGGSGFLVFYVPPERQKGVIQALRGCVHVPFRFETEGCRTIYQDAIGAVYDRPRSLKQASPVVIDRRYSVSQP